MRPSAWSLAVLAAASDVSSLAFTNEKQYRLGLNAKAEVEKKPGTRHETKPDVSWLSCELSRPMDPSEDGLVSSDDLFSGGDAIETLAKRHQPFVQIPSVCYDDLGDVDEDERWKPFREIPDLMKETYPTVHKYAAVETINQLGLVYTVKGSDDSLAPILLTAHQDVVPVEEETLDRWEYPPFGGYYKKSTGYLYGRGSSDKSAITAMMSAMEALLSQQDYQPTRTVVFAFGFDEECSGRRGAGEISKHLQERYGEDGIAVIIDEGGAGLEKVGDTLYALPAVYEKGYLDVWFDLSVVGGHSATPTPNTAIGMMADVVIALEDNPFSPQILENGPVHEGLVCFTRYTPRALPALTQMIRWGDLRGAAQLWAKVSPEKQYSIQTSQAVGSFCGGNKITSLPEFVSMGVNHRFAPQDSVGGIQHRIAKLAYGVARKYNLQVEAFKGDRDYMQYLEAHGISPESETPRPFWEPEYSGKLILEAREKHYPTPVSPTKGHVWDIFTGTIRHSLAQRGTNVVPAPGAMTGNTDTRHYLDLTRNIYRWSPGSLKSFGNIHGINEKLLMSEHVNMAKFYYDFIRNFDQANAYDQEMKEMKKAKQMRKDL
ncbi:M20-dimer domain-containing protein [Fusarium falciforme]|uniref:M20-dimer domain-containing protein n=1 Tax=Fusarium falciforme TaxID=195108 RepID=UPI002300EB44|nr:M20-dimer domain-containing protein [Fusarium falciforme]WAO91856.1 M20-dimer domain-containing protein [Fusarium falciforme]